MHPLIIFGILFILIGTVVAVGIAKINKKDDILDTVRLEPTLGDVDVEVDDGPKIN